MVRPVLPSDGNVGLDVLMSHTDPEVAAVRRWLLARWSHLGGTAFLYQLSRVLWHSLPSPISHLVGARHWMCCPLRSIASSSAGVGRGLAVAKRGPVSRPCGCHSLLPHYGDGSDKRGCFQIRSVVAFCTVHRNLRVRAPGSQLLDRQPAMRTSRRSRVANQSALPGTAGTTGLAASPDPVAG